MREGLLEPSHPSSVADFRGPIRRKVEVSQTRLALDQVEALVAEYVAGTPMRVLTERYGIPRQTIYQHACRAGVVKTPRVLTDEDAAEIVSLYRAGWGFDRLRERFHVGPPRIKRILIGAGLAIRPKGGQPGRPRSK